MRENLFSETYGESRRQFRGLLPEVAGRWPGAGLEAYPVGGDEDLTVDVLTAPPRQEKKRLLLLSCGLHGIEGYMGAAVLRYFCRRSLGELTPENTGLVLIHAINPWGMKHHRRCNENNVDLNRNFLPDWEDLDPKGFNPGYGKIDSFLNPRGPLHRGAGLAFYPRALEMLLRMGRGPFREAALLGQYRFSRGIYYGGRGYEESTKIMGELFLREAGAYGEVLFLDMHTGYGPRYQMTLTCSPLERRSSGELKAACGYPLVAKANPEEFYSMQGDMIDFFYSCMERDWPSKPFFAAALEFGTLGEGLLAQVGSIKAMIDENRAFHYGALSDALAREARMRFSNLFLPEEGRWREKALSDADRALKGILEFRGFWG